ncbi:MAG: NADH-quinone oxidoreductase subunit I [Bdellovibrionaceae bacterium]|jgi:NADH-quinone oxidoreductase subunit I|nr:NADH-quinone oxidoreductase subunit I [Pseudobdellovibrionaceae bacterium]
MSLVKKQSDDLWYMPAILSGMRFTFKTMLKNLFTRPDPKDKLAHRTYNYPEEKYEYSPRFKGNHILTVKKDGSLRCTACMLCATYCPASCIKIIASESDDKAVEKFPISYEINILRCVFCGFCEEACPVDAIRMGPEWQTPGLAAENFDYDIKKLAYRAQLEGGIPSRVDDVERHEAGI